MKSAIVFITSLLTLFTVGSPLAISADLTPRDDHGVVRFGVGPGIVDAKCSGVYAATIDVQHAGKNFKDASGCKNFLKLMGGTKATTDVDISIICQGVPPEGTGEDENKLKVVFFPPGGMLAGPEDHGVTWIDARLQATDLKANKVVTAPASIGVKLNKNDDFTITSTITEFYC